MKVGPKGGNANKSCMNRFTLILMRRLLAKGAMSFAWTCFPVSCLFESSVASITAGESPTSTFGEISESMDLVWQRPERLRYNMETMDVLVRLQVARRGVRRRARPQLMEQHMATRRRTTMSVRSGKRCCEIKDPCWSSAALHWLRQRGFGKKTPSRPEAQLWQQPYRQYRQSLSHQSLRLLGRLPPENTSPNRRGGEGPAS